jgi:hypothetical protein
MLESRVLRRIFEPKRGRLTGRLRKLHSEKLRNLFSSTNIIRVIKSRGMRWVGDVARTREIKNAYKILVGKPEGRRPLGRPRHRWVYNIKIDIREIVFEDVDSFGSG